MADLTLETVLTGAMFFGLPATPVQRAICRVADGRPLGELATNLDVITALGGPVAIELLPSVAPRRVDIYSGIRTAKSLISAAAAVCMSQRIDVTRLAPGEIPRVPILSLSKDLGDVVYSHLLKTIEARPALRSLLLDATAESLTLRHPSGRPIEITVVAGKRAGGSLVARWLAGVVFDEAPRMLGSDDGAVVSIDDALDAVEGRVLDGGQTFVIGSPYAPWGQSYESVRDYWGKPSRYRIVIKTPAPTMNPVWWTPERIEDIRVSRPRAYKTDVLGEFADAAASAIPSEWVDRAIRRTPRHIPTSAPIGVLDSSAGSGDAFTWAIAQFCVTDPDVSYESELIVENGIEMEVLFHDAHGLPKKKPNQPKPEVFMRVYGWGAIEGKFRDSLLFDDLIARIAAHWRSHGVTRGIGDQFQAWPIQSAMQKCGIAYNSQSWTQENKSEALALVKSNWFRDGRIVIDAGADAAKVRAELVQLQVVPTTKGGETIGARRKGKDDRAAIILNIGMLDSLGEFRGSPIAINRRLITHGPQHRSF